MRGAVRALASACLLALALSGCADDGPSAAVPAPGEGGDGEHGLHEAGTHLLAPEHAVGDWWTFTSPQSEAPFTHAIAGDSGSDWIVDTDSPTVAFFDARSDISFLGKVRKTDLAGSQGSQRVEFFQFPLVAHKNWTTTWDGQELRLHVMSVEDGKARVMAHRADGTMHAAYTYDAALRYFRDYAFYDANGTEVQFEAKVTSSGASHAGDLVRWSLAELYVADTFSPALRTFTVPAGLTDVWIRVAFACETGAFSLHVGPATGAGGQRGFSTTAQCPDDFDVQVEVPALATAEDWGTVQAPGTPAVQGTLAIEVLGRTLTLFKAGEAP